MPRRIIEFAPPNLIEIAGTGRSRELWQANCALAGLPGGAMRFAYCALQFSSASPNASTPALISGAKRSSLCGSSDANVKSNRDIARGRKDILRSGKEQVKDKDMLRRRKDILRRRVCWLDGRPGEPAYGSVHNTVH